MKHLHLLPIAAALLLASCGSNPEKVTLHNECDTLSWAMGMSLAQTAQSGFYQFDQTVIRQAFENTLRGGKQPIDDQTYHAACDYIAFLAQKRSIDQAKTSSQQADSLQQQYLTRLIASNSDIRQADKGYCYEVLRKGNGPTAKEGQRIRFDFKGVEMLTGKVIEQTYGVREPIVHVLGLPMFEGLLDGMQKMNAGSLYRFYFPYQLVTGANGIPPYTPVIYEVELHEIYAD